MPAGIASGNRHTLAAAGVIALALALAACGGGGSPGTRGAASTPSTGGSATTTPASTPRPHTRPSRTRTTRTRTTRTRTRRTHSSRTTRATTTHSTTTPTSTTATPTTPATSTTTTTTTTTSSATTPPPPRTQTAPAFVGGSTAPAGTALSAALAVLSRRGYTALGTATYGSGDTLHVLVGSRGGAAPAERAFFFNQTTYLGTDATAPSARITVLAHGDSAVTLGYALRDGTVASVRFALDMGLLNALDPIPSAAARS